MGDDPANTSIDEAIDSALDLLETGASGAAERVVTWVVDNLVCVLDEYRSGSISRCEVRGYDVARVGEQIIVHTAKAQVMNSWDARRLAVALLRAAEQAEQEQ